MPCLDFIIGCELIEEGGSGVIRKTFFGIEEGEEWVLQKFPREWMRTSFVFNAIKKDTLQEHMFLLYTSRAIMLQLQNIL